MRTIQFVQDVVASGVFFDYGDTGIFDEAAAYALVSGGWAVYVDGLPAPETLGIAEEVTSEEPVRRNRR